MKHSNRDTARKDRKATGCNHPDPDLHWPEEPTPKRDGKGWHWHCTCKRCGEAVFRAAREPGTDRYGLQPDMRAKVDAAWAEFADGEDMRRQRDRAALVQRLKQACLLRAIRTMFAAGSGHDCARLSTKGRAADSAAPSSVSKSSHPPTPDVFRDGAGWSRWLHDKRLDERRAREYVVVGAWLQDPASEKFREAVKREDVLPEGVPAGWTEVLAQAQAWRRDDEAQRAVDACEWQVQYEEQWARKFRQVYDGHLAEGRTEEAAQMKEKVDARERELAGARYVLRYAIRRRDRLPRLVAPGAVTVRLRGDGLEEKVKEEVEALLRPVLERYRLAASVTLKAAEPEPSGA